MTSEIVSTMEWIELGKFDTMEDEDVEGVQIDKKVYAVYRCKGAFYVTDGRCTHMGAFLCKGIVIDDIIECPLHQGRFHIPSGRTAGGPVCEDLKTYRTKTVNGVLFIAVDG